VSHRSTVEQHHSKQLRLLGDGDWQLTSIGKDTVPV
jgi:putative ATP-binding cassette transporter